MRKVFMKPTLQDMRSEESGIRRVIEAYVKYLPKFGYEVIDNKDAPHEISASHAGTFTSADIAHIHGLYWSADYDVAAWELHVNANVTASVRYAKQVTVPSAWVAETFQRDMRFTPHIIPHGIELDQYVNTESNEGYVLWNKNRDADVCSPYPVGWLASRFPKIKFVSTFRPSEYFASNLHITGIVPHSDMMEILKRAGVYLATTKETFGIGILEALAYGIPVLGFSAGGVLEMVDHRVNGYLAAPNDFDDLYAGLEYCIKNRKRLSEACIETAKRFTWEAAVEKVAHVYDLAYAQDANVPGVSVVIPTHNYGTEDKLGRAIRSVLDQTMGCDIVVVDDGSDDGAATRRLVEAYQSEHNNIRFIWQKNSGVAIARNRGIAATTTKYVCCLDSDDAIEPEFIKTCMDALEADRALGIAYTSLRWIKPDGSTGISQWPEQYDFDKQLKRQNQVPTCCVFRRVIWERLGGYDQRYAPRGAGSEDAEFWLRAGAAGWPARKITDAPMFIYSWMSGHVTADKQYREVDWTELHPWTKDDQHPFASMATPANKISHLVRQYDQPTISVIIPVGMGHEKEFLNALDSLDAQTFRGWEVIVVLNGTKFDKITKPEDDILPGSFDAIKRAYPFVRFIECKKVGAGAARNEGAKHARADLLLFLDADDWLYPEALELMIKKHIQTGDIVYSDYVGKAYMDKADAEKLKERLLNYDERTMEAVVKHYSSEYDCERAVRQPDEVNQDVYIWCLITAIVKKEWHDAIGGFDETMMSWEDWDYWIRMAKHGICFTRLPEDLVVYRFYTGTRREAGLQGSGTLLEYMVDKKKKEAADNIMPCNCGGRNNSSAPVPVMKLVSQQQTQESGMSGDNLILITYKSDNRGEHKVVGVVTHTFYGYRAGGNRFYMQEADINAMPNLYEKVPLAPPMPPSTPAPPQPEQQVQQEQDLVAEAVPSEPDFDPQTIPGITPTIASALIEMGITSYKGILGIGLDGLKGIKGVGVARAGAIYAYLKEQNDQGLL